MLADVNYLYGKPTTTGQYKQQYSDFVVKEDLGFELTGDGEHVLVYLQKCDCNTIYVAEQLAKYVGISPRLVSYAGLKDRQAVTQQWFSLHMPGQATPDFADFQVDGCQILQVTRHNKKLKIGALKGNYFKIILRELSAKTELDAKLTLIRQHGVPNYFGEQRFGRDGNNLTQALKWANGEITVKDRHKRSFYLSAARSAIFNAIVSQRIEQNLHQQVLVGDILQLAQRSSWFVAPAAELAELQQRLQQGELNITAPMVGDSPLGTEAAALEFEQNCLHHWSQFNALFKQERLATARRSLLLRPQQLVWQWLDNSNIDIGFYLPAGSYATSVIRELIIGNE
ncbi:tRNA pseudouridine(13) synthase TruD [Gilliamella sp. wkB178]|uniref:tRNA pseudouridine(13) synthase TruD n=1 Tax=Gilliamella sp. wkB178 TaxID=3120259 RepID=UPI00080EBFA6|nr:tRNA pseudouridine(13) synthase TruD [Gilliamella apicola]OCG07638.1 tRNA pseudouridine(13) synthase TruD [Gilliamella apicola]